MHTECPLVRGSSSQLWGIRSCRAAGSRSARRDVIKELSVNLLRVRKLLQELILDRYRLNGSLAPAARRPISVLNL